MKPDINCSLEVGLLKGKFHLWTERNIAVPNSQPIKFPKKFWYVH